MLSTEEDYLKEERLDMLPQSNERSYLVFVGEIRPESKIERAVAIAMASGYPLRILAQIPDAQHDYFFRTVAPLMDHPSVELFEQESESERWELIQNAKALLLPHTSGDLEALVREARSLGTPVIAYQGGPAAKYVEEGRTGFLVDSIKDGAVAVHRLREMKPPEDWRAVPSHLEVA